MIEWIASHSDQFVYVLWVQYVVLAILLLIGGHYGKAVYFLGAAILTVGIIMMR